MNNQNNFMNPNNPYVFPNYNMYHQPITYHDFKALETKINMLKILNTSDHNLIFKDFEIINTKLKLIETKNDMILSKLDELTRKMNTNTNKFNKNAKPYKPVFNPPFKSPYKSPYESDMAGDNYKWSNPLQSPRKSVIPPKANLYDLLNFNFDKNKDKNKDENKDPPVPTQHLPPETSKKTDENPQIYFKFIDENSQVPMEDFSKIIPSLLSGLNGIGKKPQLKHEEQEEVESVVSEVTEYDSEDEFEELDLNVESLDDLIKLGDLYEKLKDTKPDVTVEFETVSVDDEDKEEDKEEYEEDELDDYERKTMEVLKEFGFSEEFFEKELGRKPHAKVLTRASIKKDTTNEKKKGGYELNGKRYSIDLKKLHDLRKPLFKLKEMIGMKKVKDTMIDVILYYIQRFEKGTSDMLHTIIEGPPGVGKTELGKILGKVFKSIGIIKSDRFTIATRADLIGEYLGHTAAKTQRVIDEAEGGVLFIDEAYSLGNEEKRDSFAKECIDTINLNLDKKKGNLIVIIAGYKEELEKSFFSYNPGLKRRFPFIFSIDGYDAEELKDIFLKKVSESQWNINTDNLDNVKLTKFFKDNKSKFPHFGGDMETLFQACKFVHSKRVLGKHPKHRRKLTEDDIYKGLDKFKDMRKKKKESGLPEYLLNSMYT